MKVQQQLGLVELLKQSLAKDKMVEMTKVLQTVKKDKTVDTKHIQKIFFDNYVDPKASCKTTDQYNLKKACIEKLGGVIPKALQENYFGHFDGLFKETLSRPVKKEKTKLSLIHI